jgi:hypothetical protein
MLIKNSKFYHDFNKNSNIQESELDTIAINYIRNKC